MSNFLGNNEMSHEGFGLKTHIRGQGQVKFGKTSRNGAAEEFLIPGDLFLRNAVQSSPYSFRTYGQTVMPAELASLDLLFPCVLFDDNDFGQGAYSSKVHTRDNKPWKMYVQNDADKTIHLAESVDGITWSYAQQLDVAIFPASPNHMAEGLQVFYDKNGIFTVSGVSYPYAAIARDAAKVVGDATDLWQFYSLDGITWLKTAMANHDVSGDPFVEVAASLGLGAAYIESTNAKYGAFAATLPKTFRNADGDWWSIQKYADVPVNLGDTVPGETIMAMNSIDPADEAEMGHFANWNRKLLRQVGENSYGQCTNSYLHHIAKFKDYYIGLAQMWFQVGGGATRIRSGLALAISRDGLIFDYIGPLLDAGLTAAFNERNSVVDQADMATTAFDANAGNGTGASITAGSIVVDDSGKSFGPLSGRNEKTAHFVRVYWTEQDSGKVLFGYF